jgi:hypothetical protein
MSFTTTQSPPVAQAVVAGDLEEGATLTGRAGTAEFIVGGPWNSAARHRALILMISLAPPSLPAPR